MVILLNITTKQAVFFCLFFFQINFKVYAETEVGDLQAQTEPLHILDFLDLHPYLLWKNVLDLCLWCDWPRLPRLLQWHWHWVQPAEGDRPRPECR